MISIGELVKQSKAFDFMRFFELLQIAVQSVGIAGDVHHIFKLPQQTCCVTVAACPGEPKIIAAHTQHIPCQMW